MRYFLFSILLLCLTGCSQLTAGPHYSLIATDGVDKVIDPPRRDAYDPTVYSNPDLPYVQDLKSYREYLDRKIALLESRNGIIPAATQPKPLIRLPVSIEPKFRPRDPDDPEVLLEDALEYASEYRDFHKAYVEELKTQLPGPQTDLHQRSNL